LCSWHLQGCRLLCVHALCRRPVLRSVQHRRVHGVRQRPVRHWGRLRVPCLSAWPFPPDYRAQVLEVQDRQIRTMDRFDQLLPLPVG
jgi:hypothetical protein